MTGATTQPHSSPAVPAKNRRYVEGAEFLDGLEPTAFGTFLPTKRQTTLKVYLAGPISGLTYAQTVEWRQYASRLLLPDGIACYSPMRDKQFLAAAGKIEGSYLTHPLSGDRAIMTRDHNDVITADAVLVNLLGCTPSGSNRVTVGTVMEMAWAWDNKIPVIAIMEKTGNVHDHPMVRETIGFRTEDLDTGIEIVRSVLLDRLIG